MVILSPDAPRRIAARARPSLLQWGEGAGSNVRERPADEVVTLTIRDRAAFAKTTPIQTFENFI